MTRKVDVINQENQNFSILNGYTDSTEKKINFTSSSKNKRAPFPCPTSKAVLTRQLTTTERNQFIIQLQYYLLCSLKFSDCVSLIYTINRKRNSQTVDHALLTCALHWTRSFLSVNTYFLTYSQSSKCFVNPNTFNTTKTPSIFTELLI